MTIKKRLAVSNIIMIIIPVLITLLVGSICLGVIYLTLYHSNGFGFENGGEFFATSRAVSSVIHEVFENGSKDMKARFETIGNVIDKNTTFVQVYENEKDFYKVGNENIADKALMSSAKQIGSNAFVSNESHQLYYYCGNQNDDFYELYLFSNNSHQDSTKVKTVFILSIFVVICAIVLSIILTNRFLTRFVFKKVEQPLEMLSDGVKEISNGNLDFRLSYNLNDEFLPVCVAFNDMAARLKKSVELTKKNEENRKELLLDISHDLRSPLTSIQAYVEGLIDGVADSPQMREKYLQTIKRKTIDIEKMVSSLLAYSKLDMEEFTVNSESILFPDFLEDTIDSISDEYATKGLSVSVSQNEALRVSADRELLMRVIANILDNSLKYKNKDHAQVMLSVQKEGDYARTEIADNGPGVDEDKLEKLFEVFYRTDKARSNTGNGSGIGLAFVKKAVTAMGGSIRAENNHYGGLSVIIYLRCKDEQNTDS